MSLGREWDAMVAERDRAAARLAALEAPSRLRSDPIAARAAADLARLARLIEGPVEDADAYARDLRRLAALCDAAEGDRS